MAVKCDVKKEEDVKATFEVAKKEFGGVDVCVSNAGLGHNAPLLTGSTQDWRDMLEVGIACRNPVSHVDCLCAALQTVNELLLFPAGECSWSVYLQP